MSLTFSKPEIKKALEARIHESPYFQVEEIEILSCEDDGRFEAVVHIKYPLGEGVIEINGQYEGDDIRLDEWVWHSRDDWDA